MKMARKMARKMAGYIALLLQRASNYRHADFIVSHTQDFFQYLLVVLTQHRRRKAGAVVVAPNIKQVPGVRDTAHLGVLQLSKETAVDELRVPY